MLGYQTKVRGPALYRPLVLCMLAGQSASRFSADFTEEDAVETSLDPGV